MTNIDLLVPSYGSAERKASVVVAAFNLVATIVGGGELSFPLAFGKLGVVLATILMIFSAIITDRSLYLLCLCARMTGASSYGEVGRMAYGSWMERALSFLLACILIFVIVGYMVLLRDIWTPLMRNFMKVSWDGNVILLLIILLLTPFLVQRSLYALRYNCYISFASLSLLCAAVCNKAFFVKDEREHYDEAAMDDDEVETASLLYFTTNFVDVLFAFPILMLGFFCNFNIVPIQASLVHPSRPRMQLVIKLAVGAGFILMYLFGMAGYAYAGDETKGNILLNITSNGDDWMLVFGRFGCGVTIALAIPMMTLPCRESLLEVAETIFTKHQEELGVTLIGEQTTLLRQAPIREDPLFRAPAVHYGSTLGIILLCYFFAAVVPNVAIVWSLCGSTLVFLVAFILPSLFYIQIQKKQHTENSGLWLAFAWTLLVFSLVGASACTFQTVHHMLTPSVSI